MMSEHWPRGTLVTRLYEGDSFALSLIRLSGETRAHRSPSARPAFLTVRRLLYSNDSFHSFSSAEFCSAYQTPYIHGHCPASPLLWPRPTPRFAFAIARPPKFLTELSRRVVLLCPAAPARPKPIRALGVGFTASELLAARNSSNETLRRRFICIATHLFVRQDSRIRVAPLTACRPNLISVCL